MSAYMQEIRQLVGTRLVLVPGVAAILRDPDGRVLLVRTTAGHWSLPAGAIDPGETPRETVVREVREETGLEVRPVRVIDVVGGRAFRWTYDNGDRVEGTIAVFECEVIGGTLHCDGNETVEARWVAPEDAPGMLPLPFPPSLFTPEPRTP